MSSSLSSRSASAPRVRARSVPAVNSPTAHRPGVDQAFTLQARFRMHRLHSRRSTSTWERRHSSLHHLLCLLSCQFPSSGTLDQNTVNLFRQMMQAQDEQIRASQAQVQQLTSLVKDLAVLGVQNAGQAAASGATTAPASSSGDPSGPAPMDVDTGIRSRRAENYIPTLPQLNFASMNTRHAEIRVWSAYKEELTSWLCLLDDRFAEELDDL